MRFAIVAEFIFLAEFGQLVLRGSITEPSRPRQAVKPGMDDRARVTDHAATAAQLRVHQFIDRRWNSPTIDGTDPPRSQGLRRYRWCQPAYRDLFAVNPHPTRQRLAYRAELRWRCERRNRERDVMFDQIVGLPRDSSLTNDLNRLNIVIGTEERLDDSENNTQVVGVEQSHRLYRRVAWVGNSFDGRVGRGSPFAGRTLRHGRDKQHCRLSSR